MQVQKRIILFCAIIEAWLFVLLQICYATEGSKPADLIYFVRNRNLWQIDLDTKRESMIIEGATSPACAKNMWKIAFVKNGNIWISDKNGKNPKKITQYTAKQKSIRELEWFPSGEKLAFTMNDNYELTYSGKKRKVVWPEAAYERERTILSISNIWIVNVNDAVQEKWIGRVPGSGTTGTQLSDVRSPKWSPKGESVVFSRNGDVWIANIVNDDLSPFDKKEKRIAAIAYLENHYGGSGNSLFADHFSWTPDGNQIVYEIHRFEGSGFGEIWKMNADGSGQIKLISTDDESFPQLSSDGDRVAFIREFNLWIMSSDGSSPVKIVENVDIDQIAWCTLRPQDL